VRIAVIADVHGNRWALAAVLADADRHGVEAVVDLGDSVYGPLDPGGAAAMLMERAVPSMSGNQDRIVLKPATPEDAPTLTFTRAGLAPAQLRWLAEQPAVSSYGGGILLCHGTPQSDDEYLLERVVGGCVRLRSDEELTAALQDVEEGVVACGHSHMARVVAVPGGPPVVNPGSVGLPAHSGAAPSPYVIESGSPHARYAVIEKTADGWRVEQLAIPYDWESAARVAAANGRPDWAGWLRTGRALLPAGGVG
jgi:predicted phosphodiesterase